MTGRVLIADNTATNRIILKVKLGASCYESLQAETDTQAFELALNERPDLIILDARLPGEGGVALCRRLKSDPRTRAIPVLIIDAAETRATRLAAFAAGADEYLPKPLDETTLLALVRNLMRTRAAFDELTRRQDTIADMGFAEPVGQFSKRPNVAIVGPGAETTLIWRHELEDQLAASVATETMAEALDQVRREQPHDAYVIGADLVTKGDGLRLVSELRSRADTRHAVILVHDTGAYNETIPMALDIGASAVMSGIFDAQETAQRLKTLLARKMETDALRASVDERLDLAVKDPLTGIYNRRYAETYLSRLSRQATSSGQPFALMLIDLDRFKLVNDTYGHLVGDQVLAETARRLNANLREIDLLARFGGEEFVVAMPKTDIDGAFTAAERLRRIIGDIPMRPRLEGPEVSVTVSIGVVVCHGDEGLATMRQLLDLADQALYASKADGRNLVTFATDAAA